MNRACKAPRAFEERQHGERAFLYASLEHDCSDPLQKIILSHWHRAFELIWIKRGSGVFRIGGETVHLEAGEYTVASPGMLHSGMAEDNAVFGCLLFHPSLFGYASPAEDPYYAGRVEPLVEGRRALRPLPRGDGAEIFPLCREIAAAITSGAGELRVISSLFLLLDALLSNHEAISAAPEPPGSPNQYVRQALQYIHAHYGELITSTGLAERLNVSLPYFCRIFAAQTGVSPMQYLHLVRVQAAQALLSDRELSVAEVAARCSFADAGYFSRTFRSVTGVSPSEFRSSGTFRRQAVQ